jgi:magnesium chelatase family protein
MSISRAGSNIEFPANFTLVAATNPCPCGYSFSTKKACRCNRQLLQKYEQKLSGPLLDRFDLCIHVPEIEQRHLLAPPPVITAAMYQHMIVVARRRQQQRFGKPLLNGELSSKEVRIFCHLDKDAQKSAHQAVDRLQLSARSYFKVIKVAQTIADIEEEDVIQKKHIAEALQYR